MMPVIQHVWMTLGDYVNKLCNLPLEIAFFLPYPKAFKQELVILQALKWLMCYLSSPMKDFHISSGGKRPRSPTPGKFFYPVPIAPAYQLFVNPHLPPVVCWWSAWWGQCKRINSRGMLGRDHLWDTLQSYHLFHWGLHQLCGSDCGNSMGYSSNPQHRSVPPWPGVHRSLLQPCQVKTTWSKSMLRK